MVANRSTVNGDLQAFHNVGGMSITSNRTNAGLQCKANTPPPTGGGNIVQGNKQDQCARLWPERCRQQRSGPAEGPSRVLRVCNG